MEVLFSNPMSLTHSPKGLLLLFSIHTNPMRLNTPITQIKILTQDTTTRVEHRITTVATMTRIAFASRRSPKIMH